MTKSDSLIVEAHGATEVMTLNRPDALNAMDEPLIAAMTEYLRSLHDRPDIRVVILRGAGRSFCAGLDLKSWANDGRRSAMHHMWHAQRSIAQVMLLMRSCPQPIIGLGHGAACGGGFSLLLASDIRYGAPSLRMNAAYIRIGLGGCDMGSSYFLPRLIGASVASELILTGRFIDAERALRVNLISEIVPEDRLLDVGMGLAEEMLLTAPMGLRLTKDGLNLAIDAASLDVAMAIEDRQQVMLSAGEDHREAVDAFLGKRTPAYADR